MESYWGCKNPSGQFNIEIQNEVYGNESEEFHEYFWYYSWHSLLLYNLINRIRINNPIQALINIILLINEPLNL